MTKSFLIVATVTLTYNAKTPTYPRYCHVLIFMYSDIIYSHAKGAKARKKYLKNPNFDLDSEISITSLSKILLHKIFV